MAELQEHPDVLRLIVVFLRFYARMGQTGLAKAARLAQSKISMLESGSVTPSEDVLRRIASATGAPWEAVTQLRQALNAFLSAVERGGPGTQPSAVYPESLAISAYLLEDMAPERERPSEARLAAEHLWQELAGLSSPRRRRAIELSPRASRNWALAELLCRESKRAASENPKEALELAELALSVAGRVEGTEEWRRRLQGYAWAFVGNARRVGNDHPGAGAAFVKGWELWRSGSDRETGLLQEWRMLSLEASLRRDERRFDEALDLLGRARQAAGGEPEAHAVILLKREFVCEVMGDLEGALAALQEAAPYVERTGDSRLLFALRFETAKCLSNLERHMEAASLLPEVRELAGRLGHQLDLLRSKWLEARLAARAGRIQEAIAGQEEVRKSFVERGLPYDAALASLDLAVLYLEAGRTGEVKELAREMAEIFKAQGIAREALAALTLFVEAAQKETATVELVRRVIQKVEGAGR